MSESQATIYVEPGEEITSIIDRLRNEQAERVAIVVPKGATITQSVINLKLLKRHSDNLGKSITVATTDRIGRNLASKAGIIVQKRPGAKPEAPVHEPMPQVTREKPPEQKKPKLQVHQYGEAQKKTVAPIATTVSKVGSSNAAAESLTMEEILGDAEQATKRKKQSAAPPSKVSSRSKRGQERREQKLSKNNSLAELQPKRKQKRTYHVPKIGLTIIGVFLAALIIVGAVLAVAVLPRAEVTITTATETVQSESEILAATSTSEVDEEASTIPATTIAIEKEVSKDFQATGTEQIEEFAAGTITVTNTFDSSTQTLVTGTRFISKEGKVFRTTTQVNVPGFTRVNGEDKPGVATVKVQAEEAGEGSNVPAGQFTIPGFAGTPKADAITGSTTIAMSGGEIREATVVTAEDLSAAEAALKTQAFEELEGELEASSEGFVLNDKGTQGETTFETSADRGDEATNFSATLTLKQEALVYKEEDVQQIVERIVETTTPANTQLLEDTLIVSVEPTEYDTANGRITILVSMNAKTIAEVDTSAIKAGIRGESEQGAREFLRQQQAIEDSNVKLWPFWVKSIPDDDDRITVSLDTKED